VTRGAAAFVGLVLAAAAIASSADEAPAPPPVHGVELLRPAGPWRWQIVTAPAITRSIGALAVTGVDVAAGRAKRPFPVLGEPLPVPAGWPYDHDGTATAIGKPPEGRRIAAAFGLTTFAITDPAIAMLELRLRYRDGVAVWINGLEVARDSLPRGSTVALATHPHGPEWQTFYIPAAPGLLRRGSNVLAVEVHPSGRRDAPMLAADLVGRSDRGIVRGPFLAESTATAATIVVDTDPDVDATLEWGTGDATDRTQASPAGRRHEFRLTGLSASSRFSYRVRAGSTVSPRYGFHTMPGKGAVIRIGIYGDVRGGHAMHRRLVEHMLDEGLDLVAVSGDMVLNGSDEADWQRFFAITRELRAQVPYYPAVGNHDLGWNGPDDSDRNRPGAAGAMMLALPPGPPGRPSSAFWYSRDVADVHLVFLDSNNYDQPEQEGWLEADLAAARRRGVRAVIAFVHDGPYSRGYHGGSSLARARYVPILARHHVDLLVAGHDHLYQRGEAGGIRYVVSGGGGASLYSIRCGIPGRPRCKVDDGMLSIVREHHYGVLTIGRDLELCPRRADGSLLERCSHLPLWKP